MPLIVRRVDQRPGCRCSRSEILHLAGQNRRFVFHGVHMTLDGRPGRRWKPTDARQNELVFIGRNLDEAALREGFDACRVAELAPVA